MISNARHLLSVCFCGDDSDNCRAMAYLCPILDIVWCMEIGKIIALCKVIVRCKFKVGEVEPGVTIREGNPTPISIEPGGRDIHSDEIPLIGNLVAYPGISRQQQGRGYNGH